ncbi:MAG: hypothetical protein J4F29_15250 [Candidatus Latescibacteria bacterium]|nr:hypothetical protein [Candidatus Latescibacterota bacterium]
MRPTGDEGNWDDALEEERRLFYVGITRAEDRLFLSYAMRRQRYGGAIACTASQFLSEIPEDLLDVGFKISETSSVPRPKSNRESARRVNPGEPFLMDVGSWVVHPAWGRGQIQSRAGSGQTAKLKVKFDGGAVKTIVVEYANLQPG